MTDRYFRYVDNVTLSGPMNIDGDMHSTRSSTVGFPNLVTFKVVSTTPKGVWIEFPDNASGKKFIKTVDAKRQYAHTNRLDALNSYNARKNKEVKIYTERLKIAERCKEMGQRALTELGKDKVLL